MSELCPHLKLHSDEAFKALEQRATAAERERDELRTESVAYLHEIAELQEAQRWIPVEERTPGAFYQVLIRWHEDTIFGYWSNIYKGFLLSGGETEATQGVTHWMELPKPPEPHPTAGTGRAAGDED